YDAAWSGATRTPPRLERRSEVTILRLGSSHIAVAATGKQVRYVSRELRVSADGLDYDLWMAYTHVPETHHLAASLQRVG
ncbi:MAG: hypothetical protein ACOCT8_05560, partial [Actinomycetota bacterium]